MPTPTELPLYFTPLSVKLQKDPRKRDCGTLLKVGDSRCIPVGTFSSITRWGYSEVSPEHAPNQAANSLLLCSPKDLFLSLFGGFVSPKV